MYLASRSTLAGPTSAMARIVVLFVVLLVFDVLLLTLTITSLKKSVTLALCIRLTKCRVHLGLASLRPKRESLKLGRTYRWRTLFRRRLCLMTVMCMLVPRVVRVVVTLVGLLLTMIMLKVRTGMLFVVVTTMLCLVLTLTLAVTSVYFS